MPCDQADHSHNWPDTGKLIINRCEIYCQYCQDEEGRNHRWKYAWFLRRHVEAVHTKRPNCSNPLVTVSAGWTNNEGGNARPAKKKAAARRNHARNQSGSSGQSSSPSPAHSRNSSNATGSEVQVALQNAVDVTQQNAVDVTQYQAHSSDDNVLPTTEYDVFCGAPASAPVFNEMGAATAPTFDGTLDFNAFTNTVDPTALNTINPAALTADVNTTFDFNDFNGLNNPIDSFNNPTDLPSSVDDALL